MTEEELDALKQKISDAVSKVLEEEPKKFELNTEETRNRVQEFLQDVYNRHNMQYEVICNETNNTPETIDKGFLIVDTFPFGIIPIDELNKG
jgi:polyhydroxyalkanoate synthesis regulator phasin